MAEIDPFILQIFGPPPPGLDVFETKQKINYIIIAVSIVLAALAVLGRCVSRRISGANLGADDCVIMIAFVCLSRATNAVRTLTLYAIADTSSVICRDRNDVYECGYVYTHIDQIR